MLFVLFVTMRTEWNLSLIDKLQDEELKSTVIAFRFVLKCRNLGIRAGDSVDLRMLCIRQHVVLLKEKPVISNFTQINYIA